jgi:hypothetical protein
MVAPATSPSCRTDRRRINVADCTVSYVRSDGNLETGFPAEPVSLNTALSDIGVTGTLEAFFISAPDLPAATISVQNNAVDVTAANLRHNGAAVVTGLPQSHECWSFLFARVEDYLPVTTLQWLIMGLGLSLSLQTPSPSPESTRPSSHDGAGECITRRDDSPAILDDDECGRRCGSTPPVRQHSQQPVFAGYQHRARHGT